VSYASVDAHSGPQQRRSDICLAWKSFIQFRVHACFVILLHCSCLVLRCTISGTRSLRLSNDPGKDATWPLGLAEVFLTKQRPTKIDAASMLTDVVITSAPKSAAEALYSAIHTAFLPTILSNADGRSGTAVDERVKEMLKELDKTLGDAVRRAGTGASARPDGMSGVLSVHDELRYWEDLARGPGRERERSVAFSSSLKLIASRFDRIADSSLPDLIDLIAETQAALDAIWQAKLPAAETYPEARMKSLLLLVGGNISAAVTSSCAARKVWAIPSGDFRIIIRDAARVCESWLECTNNLTSVYWDTGTSDRRWTLGTLLDDNVVALLKRINDISRLRALHDEVTSLLSERQRIDLNWDEVLRPLVRGNIFSVASFPQHEWDAAVLAFERSLEPIEAACAGVLSSRLKATRDTFQLLAAEVSKFTALLARKALLRALTAEREAILAGFTSEVGDVCHSTLQLKKVDT
jgi:hypothetical protein